MGSYATEGEVVEGRNVDLTKSGIFRSRRLGGAGSRHPGDGFGGAGGGTGRAVAESRAPRRSAHGGGSRYEHGGMSRHGGGSRYEDRGMSRHGGQPRGYGMGGHSEDEHSDYAGGTISDDDWY